MHKYQFTGQSICFAGKKLYRIIAVKDFGNVKAGTLGGFIETEKNLSQEGDCWAFSDSKIFGNAVVKDDARIFNEAVIRDNASIEGNARIEDYSEIFGNAVVTDFVRVIRNARIGGDAKVYGKFDVDAHDVEILSNKHFLVYGPADELGRFIVFYRTRKNEIAANYEWKQCDFKKMLELPENTEFRKAAEAAMKHIELSAAKGLNRMNMFSKGDR